MHAKSLKKTLKKLLKTCFTFPVLEVQFLFGGGFDKAKMAVPERSWYCFTGHKIRVCCEGGGGREDRPRRIVPPLSSSVNRRPLMLQTGAGEGFPRGYYCLGGGAAAVCCFAQEGGWLVLLLPGSFVSGGITQGGQQKHGNAEGEEELNIST